MLYLRIESPGLPLEQKKIMAAELTEAIRQTLPHLEPAQVQLHFAPYEPENVAVGGRLVSETEEPIYRFSFYDSLLNPETQERLMRALMPLVLEELTLPESAAKLIQFRFHSHASGDWYNGDVALKMLEQERQAETVV